MPTDSPYVVDEFKHEGSDETKTERIAFYCSAPVHNTRFRPTTADLWALCACCSIGNWHNTFS